MAIGKSIKNRRNALGLTQEELARKAEVPYTTLTKVESGAIQNPSINVISKLAGALDRSIDDLVAAETMQGENSLKSLFKDILNSLPVNETMYISGVDEKLYLDIEEESLKNYLEELKKRGNKQKILSCEGDEFRLPGKHLEYRWLPKKYFSPIPIYVYSNKIASIVWEPTLQVIIVRNKHFANAYKNQFLLMWESALKIPDHISV